MRSHSRWLALLLPALICARMEAQPARLSHARLRSEPIAGTLRDTIYKLLPEGGGATWAAWEEPKAGPRRVCCFGSIESSDWHPCGGRCDLESEDRDSGFFDSDAGDCVERAGTEKLFIFVRLEAKAVVRVRTFSQDCTIDAEGRPVVWLTGVSPADSVAFLERLVAEPDPGFASRWEKHSSESALAAIALHGDAAADGALERLVAPGEPEAIRKQAVFWLGNARGRRGYEVLARLARDEPSRQLRRQVTFALSQSHEPEALDTLMGMARSDPDPSVRGQALFWLAQKAGKKAAAAIRDAIHNDPETEVKRRAVFALTQLPNGEGVPQLIEVARTNRNPEVRKQAIFWLGQSKDPRALAFLEEILTK